MSGEKANFRLVTILPQAQGCAVTIQRVQEYTVPPRVFDAREQRVLRVLAEVTKHYQAAQHVAYTMEQRTQLPATAGQPQPPVLTWTLDFTRPAQLTLTAAVGETTGLRITTEQDGLHVARQMEQSGGASVERRTHHRRRAGSCKMIRWHACCWEIRW